MNLSAYGKPLVLGHRYLIDLFNGPIVVQEKLDGSQFSFAKLDGELCIRSRGKQIDPHEPPALFSKACARVRDVQDLIPGDFIFRGEALNKPCHNVLRYGREPRGGLVLFDIETDLTNSNFLEPDMIAEWAHRLGFDYAPVLYESETGGTLEEFRVLAIEKKFLWQDSVLGGCKIEGFVVKNYNQFDIAGKILMGKFVSDEFKEVHKQAYKNYGVPGRGDILQQLRDQYATEARWRKAVQHLDESGELTQTPADIGALCRLVPADILEECEADIKNFLFDVYWKDMRRIVVRGLAEWYKEQIGGV